MQNNDSSPPPGAVELREDLPLKGAGGGGGACAGPRLIAGCFAALSAAVAVALLTQIYYGDYQVVPHGSVATDAEACSAAGAGALKAGGRAADAAVAAALCLALLAPHRTSIDASGALVYWEYRSGRAQGPQQASWGGPGAAGPGAAGPGAEGPAGARAPRLLAALAALHAARGALPWPRVLQPAIDLARSGFVVSKGLAEAAAAAGAGAAWAAGAPRADPAFADYLEALQRNTSSELSAAWSARLRWRAAPAARAGGWALAAGGAGAGPAARALAAALQPPPADIADAERRAVNALVAEASVGADADARLPAGGVAAGLAVVDPVDTYLALVTGLSVPFGSQPPWGAAGAAGARDEPAAPLDVAPAILVDGEVCGTRVVLGAESSSALAQAAAALAARAPGAELAGALERPRLAPGAAPAAAPAAVNAVLQRGDALASHADSRGGGLASRF